MANLNRLIQLINRPLLQAAILVVIILLIFLAVPHSSFTGAKASTSGATRRDLDAVKNETLGVLLSTCSNMNMPVADIPAPVREGLLHQHAEPTGQT